MSPRKPRVTLPPEQKAAIVDQLVAGTLTPEAVAAEHGLAPDTPKRWAADRRRLEGRTPAEAAREAAGPPPPPPKPRPGVAPTGAAPGAPPPVEPLKPEALVELSQVAVAIPLGVYGRAIKAPEAAVDRACRFTPSERSVLLGLAPLAAPGLSDTLNRYPNAGAALYAVALAAIGWAHARALKLEARPAPTEKRSEEPTAGRPPAKGGFRPPPNPWGATQTPAPTPPAGPKPSPVVKLADVDR